MSKSRICEVLGVEPDERFEIVGYKGWFYANEKGAYFMQNDNDKPMWITSTTLINAINHPQKIIRHPRWTEKDAADAKAIKQLFPDAVEIGRDGAYFVLFDEEGCMIEDELCLNILSTIKDTETVRLHDIIGGSE